MISFVSKRHVKEMESPFSQAGLVAVRSWVAVPSELGGIEHEHRGSSVILVLGP